MKSKIFFLLSILGIFMLSSCSRSLSIRQGGQSDISLNRNSSEYVIKRLKPITVDGKAFWGIPSNNNPTKDKHGMIVKFNGLNLGKLPKILPILSMVAYTFVTGTIIDAFVGKKDNINVAGQIAGLMGYSILALPVSGTLNNLTWSSSAISGVSDEMNYRIVNENPDVDFFLNPKYNVKHSIDWWKQTAKVEAKVMGATIKTN